MFENSKWLVFRDVDANLTRSRFTAAKPVKKATLNITALGYFEAYINGVSVTTDRLMPAKSEYEQRDLTTVNMPIVDKFTYTIYYREFDITKLLAGGDNVLGVHIGAGWYGQRWSPNEGMSKWGDNCLVFEIDLEYEDGTADKIYSAPDNTKWKTSWIKICQLYYGEYQDYEYYESDWNLPSYNDEKWLPCEVRKAPGSSILKAEFPSDKVTRSIIPEKIYAWGDSSVYDLHETAAGTAVIRFTGEPWRNKIAYTRYAELLNDDMSLSFHSCGGTTRIQGDEFRYDARYSEGMEFYPHFTWHAGRYIEVRGDVEVVRFDVIETEIKQTAEFHTENKVLQWLFDTYVLTQHANIHGCVPSDCPHRERLGYTGDGQLTSNAVMTIFDARGMYKKWLHDIRDSQGENGHVQHTAPFYGGGGGPGGWGGAMVIVPYNYYKHYKDTALVEEYMPAMKLYISYMLSRSEDGLVVREEEKGWCLGDWVPPYDKVLIPEPFVNTYFLSKCCTMLSELCAVTGDSDAAKYAALAEDAKQSIVKHYFNAETGSFLEGVQGADAFAVDIGAGDERTLENLVARYEKLGTFDTGIFGTDILIRVLFEKGYASLAVRILANEEKETSYGWMMKSGATTLWENWNGVESLCHPMYGAVCAYLFEYILGIREEDGEVVIKPAFLPELGAVSGSAVKNGRKITVAVTYENGIQNICKDISPAD